MTDLSKWEPFIVRGECEGDRAHCTAVGCPVFGKLARKPARDEKRRVRGCGDRVARGKRAKQAGARGQRKAAKQLGISTHGLHGGHEENYGGRLRIEVKQGKQVEQVWKAFALLAPIPPADRSQGSGRPAIFFETSDGFPLVAMTPDWSPQTHNAIGLPKFRQAATIWRSTRAQSEQHRPVGDNRPFVCALVPPGSRDVLVIFEAVSLSEVLESIRGEK